MAESLTPEISAAMTRRQFFRRSTAGIAIGIPALATLLATDGFAADDATNPKTGGLVGLPHSRQRPGVSSFCTNPERPRRWSYLTTSRTWSICKVRSYLIPFEWASALPA